jgi:hypothetical protein
VEHAHLVAKRRGESDVAAVARLDPSQVALEPDGAWIIFSL